jgi:WD40 repeat protein
VASGESLCRPSPGHDGIVFSIAASADGCRVVSGGEDGTVRLWDTASGEQVGGPLKGHDGWVYAVALSTDGSRVVSGGLDWTVRVWDTVSMAPLCEPLEGNNRCAHVVALNENTSHVASRGGYDKTGDLDCPIWVWDVASRDCDFVFDDDMEHAVETREEVQQVAQFATATTAPLENGPRIHVESDTVWLTTQGNSSATWLATLDSNIETDCWHFDECRRMLWIGLCSGGPFRVELVEKAMRPRALLPFGL